MFIKIGFTINKLYFSAHFFTFNKKKALPLQRF